MLVLALEDKRRAQNEAQRGTQKMGNCATQGNNYNILEEQATVPSLQCSCAWSLCPGLEIRRSQAEGHSIWLHGIDFELGHTFATATRLSLARSSIRSIPSVSKASSTGILSNTTCDQKQGERANTQTRASFDSEGVQNQHGVVACPSAVRVNT